jgi:Putative Flp pilus-assembly TadE/G-like
MTRKSEAGQALAFAAVALVALLGAVGLAIDMGVLRYERRLQQTAADAAAIAGASNLAYGGITAGALDASSTNGFADNTNGGSCQSPPTNLAVGSVAVIVCNPPIAGPHTGDANYVEAYVAAGHPTFFMKALGVTQETVTARAVATNLSGGSGAGNGCLYSLGPPQASIEGVNLTGSATLNAPGCGIVDNGNFNTQGNALTVNAATFGVSGCDVWGNKCRTGAQGSISCTLMTDCPATGMPVSGDPMAGTPSPCNAGYQCTICPLGSNCTVTDPAIVIDSSGSGCVAPYCGYNSSTNTFTVSPGTYSSITITGGGTNPTVVFQPGMYILDGVVNGGINQTGNATMNGTGVTFYFLNNATPGITGTPIINLSAPTSGTYAGVLMYQAEAPCTPGVITTFCGTAAPFDVNLSQNTMLTGDKGPELGGNSGSNYQGILYFPSDQLTFFGNNCTGCGTFDVGVVITYSIALSGNPNVNILGSNDVPGGAGSTVGAFKNAVLVE